MTACLKDNLLCPNVEIHSNKRENNFLSSKSLYNYKLAPLKVNSRQNFIFMSLRQTNKINQIVLLFTTIFYSFCLPYLITIVAHYYPTPCSGNYLCVCVFYHSKFENIIFIGKLVRQNVNSVYIVFNNCIKYTMFLITY